MPRLFQITAHNHPPMVRCRQAVLTLVKIRVIRTELLHEESSIYRR